MKVALNAPVLTHEHVTGNHMISLVGYDENTVTWCTENIEVPFQVLKIRGPEQDECWRARYELSHSSSMDRNFLTASLAFSE